MISAMPAVALRRERGKPEKTSPRKKGKQSLIEYYNRKISRVGSRDSYIPPRGIYSGSPDLERTLEEEDDSPMGRFKRKLGQPVVFHVGCIFIGIGLLLVFVSVSKIKADLTSLRAAGSTMMVIGAILCLVRTVFYQKPPPAPLLMLRNSDSFNARNSSNNEPSDALPEEPPLPSSPSVNSASPSHHTQPTSLDLSRSFASEGLTPSPNPTYDTEVVLSPKELNSGQADV